jgi:hypothetical protein
VASEADLTAFAREHVGTVWGLELLLLLRRDAARGWSPAELVGELRASAGLVSDNLRRLTLSGLVAPDGEQYRFAPASAVLEDLCAQLEAAYRARPVSVVNMIAKPATPLQSLADAFRFRGGDS